MRQGTIVWVEIPVRDLRRSADFYAALFGWSFEPDVKNIEWIFTPPGRGAMGAITTRRPIGPGGARIGVAVDDVQSTANRAIALGGAPTSEPVTPTVGRAVDLVDPDGNHLWLYQRDVATAADAQSRADGSP
jgi:predicted enzyme related to lactoylglutathione lyase